MYRIITFCDTIKFENIVPYWMNRINLLCKDHILTIIKKTDDFVKDLNLNYSKYAWWDIIRMTKVIECLKNNETVVHCDLDIILKKDIKDLIDLDYDLIISKEIGEDKAFPPKCSKVLGFGVCTGFYIAKPPALTFLTKVLDNMNKRKFNDDSYSDQETIMNILINDLFMIYKEKVILNNIEYTNTILVSSEIKICVLDFEIIRRDPITDENHYGLHINIDNVGGPYTFTRYFHESFKSLPRTCRCALFNQKCTHITL